MANSLKASFRSRIFGPSKVREDRRDEDRRDPATIRPLSWNNFLVEKPAPVFRRRERLMGEKVRDIERALAISEASGGVMIQEVRSGTPLERITCKTERDLWHVFPRKLKKHDYVVVQGVMPRTTLAPRP